MQTSSVCRELDRQRFHTIESYLLHCMLCSRCVLSPMFLPSRPSIRVALSGAPMNSQSLNQSSLSTSPSAVSGTSSAICNFLRCVLFLGVVLVAVCLVGCTLSTTRSYCGECFSSNRSRYIFCAANVILIRGDSFPRSKVSNMPCGSEGRPPPAEIRLHPNVSSCTSNGWQLFAYLSRGVEHRDLWLSPS